LQLILAVLLADARNSAGEGFISNPDSGGEC
jgi:hypothetical protein